VGGGEVRVCRKRWKGGSFCVDGSKERCRKEGEEGSGRDVRDGVIVRDWLDKIFSLSFSLSLSSLYRMYNLAKTT